MRLLYFSPVAWRSFAQRPHRFVEWFHARHGASVLWVDPYPTRLPTLSDMLRISTPARALTGPVDAATPPWLTIVRPPALPIEPLPGSVAVNGLLWRGTVRSLDSFIAADDCLIAVGKPSELALQILQRHPSAASVFDVMDDFSEFYQGLSRCSMARRTGAVAAGAKRILVSSNALAHSFGQYRAKLTLVRNACATESLPQWRRLEPSATVRKVFGYVGAIGPWFDWALVHALAVAFPSAIVRLIGPLYSLSPILLPANVELQPACSNTAALQSMASFNMGLIPFKQNALTASVDPIKYYEYRATGLPVLSTVFGEMALRKGLPGVFLASQSQELSPLVRAALAYRCEADEVRVFRAQNSWAARFDAEYSRA